MAVQEPIFRHLTDDGLVGDGTNHLANVDGSSTSVALWAGPSSNMWAIHRLIIAIKDTGNLAADKYGAATALTNGVKCRIMAGHQKTGTVITDLLDGDDIVSNIEWAEHCYDMTEHSFGAGDNFVVVRWTFSASGRPLILDSRDSEKLVVLIQDDCTVLTDHQFQIQGHVINDPNHQLNTWGA